jgi:hypothetical protein
LSEKRDLPIRSLEALYRSGSTSRVLNLARVGETQGHLPEHAEQPFFLSPLLNRAFILKHRLRLDEVDSLKLGRRLATKVIIPFDRRNLALGGSSLFVGQSGWLDILGGVAGGGDAALAHDSSLLERLDELPSFDPFLLREHLRRHDFEIADCYFGIAPADRERMQEFVSGEVSRLIELAFAEKRATSSTAKLVEILLSQQTDERLEPLRLTLRLEGDSYREGIFCWKGFLYYKWLLSTLTAELRTVSAEIEDLTVVGRREPEDAAFIAGCRVRVRKTIDERCNDVRAVLRHYDNAFLKLTRDGDATAFRDFLLTSPVLFLELGERVGMISHVATFWRYRFPLGAPLRASVEEALDLFHDFEIGLAQQPLYVTA